jgi:ABC-type Fe3+-hydroxamate transport system substrate-binding protein
MLPNSTQTYTDMMGRTIVLPNHVNNRIISLVPSQTELLVDLGLADNLVGITKFCIHPKHIIKSKPRSGGTKQLDFEKISALNPTIIIANKEENEKAQIESLCEEFPVWISDIYDLADNEKMILSLGDIFHKNEQAQQIVNTINTGFNGLIPLAAPKNVVYFIWKNPYMVAGNNTFINYMLEKLGFNNLFKNDSTSRYPALDKQALQELNPEVVFLSSEPFPFKEKHIDEFQNLWPSANIKLVDGEMFSWYGSRLMHAPAYFNLLIKDLNG